MTSLLTSSFSSFDKRILTALAELGYEKTTPIQEQSIPILLAGEDLLAQAQTGTGKTAAFALPILSRLNLALQAPQALVLAPTRELAIQVSEAFRSYAKYIPGFSVAPIYGGQDFTKQLRLIKRGIQVLVCTPGRLMDHLRRGNIKLHGIQTVVIDEADEMLKMGFVDDVEWILSQLTLPHQTALFSATIPSSIQKMAQKYLKNAKKIHIKQKTNTADTIDQFYMIVDRDQKLDLLTRILEIETSEGVLVFSRTKQETANLSDKLQARGYTASALHGDMNQSVREKTIERFKRGALDILVATDVAARGLDVERIQYVINYDIPYDVDSYIHRIGRTGRAGRAGRAILFVTPREQRLFRDIENHIKTTIKRMSPPSLADIREKKCLELNEKILGILRENQAALPNFLDKVKQFCRDNDVSPSEMAAAFMLLHQKDWNKSPTAETMAFSDFEKPNHQRRDFRKKESKRFSKNRFHAKKKNGKQKPLGDEKKQKDRRHQR